MDHPDKENLNGYELFSTDKSSRGSVGEVYINKKKKLVRKYYRVGGTTITGKPPTEPNSERLYEYQDFKKFYETQLYWSEILQGNDSVSIVDHGRIENGFYFVQEYVGPSLITIKDNLKQEIPNVVEQVVAYYEKLKKYDIYTMNSSMSNFVFDSNGVIKAFDYKWTEKRNTENKKYEEKCVNDWIVKIDPTLPKLIQPLL